MVVGVGVLVTEPFPPLFAACESEGWTEAIEFVAINLIAWIALSLLGFLPMKIGIGTDGMVAERRQAEAQRDSAAAEVGSLATKTIERMDELVDVCEMLAEEQQALAARVDALHATVHDRQASKPEVSGG